jgi:hypothetical protein
MILGFGFSEVEKDAACKDGMHDALKAGMSVINGVLEVLSNLRGEESCVRARCGQQDYDVGDREYWLMLSEEAQ